MKRFSHKKLVKFLSSIYNNNNIDKVGRPIIFFFFLLQSYCGHIIGRKHSVLATSMNSAAHPTVVNLDAVDNQITIAERNLVIILGVIIINSLVAVLKKKKNRVLNTHISIIILVVGPNYL